ncbi:hypothetical protein O181_050948 [Austropuccinia psidii MF-1]|uniref:Protein phosphatase methylesterase 1 n=1 Tax=Austropuccinia psidii MF-1 TaxID=1389203 RepID=A0A9Q3E016_9BASI|nr:hypothetical protein [Austropuccinia psidii MF-1]
MVLSSARAPLTEPNTNLSFLIDFAPGALSDLAPVFNLFMLRSALAHSAGRSLSRPSDGGRPASLHQKYSPQSASDCFEQALIVTVEPQRSFRVYFTPPKPSHTLTKTPVCSFSHPPVVFVFHHGAGYSALSAACFAKEVRSQSNGEFGVLSFDCRGHGSSQVGSIQPADLSLLTLANDLVDLLRTMYPNRQQAPAFVLIGHSMGGAVVTEACASIQAQVGRVLGLVVLDVVEGTAMSSLASMMPLVESRPSKFSSQAECIKYHIDSHTIRNLASACISVPGIVKKCSSPVTDDPPADSTSEHESPQNEYFTWVTDLRSSQPYWEGWYSGLSKKFLSQRTARLLVLAGADRLDKELIIGQMQGKYQLSVLANVGHCIHEDDPEKLAEIVITFAQRNDTMGSEEILARLGKKPFVPSTPL